MPRLTAKDFPQELLDYYDYYAHGKISKREFLNLAAKYAVGGMTALALFDLLKPNYAWATQWSLLTRRLSLSTSRILRQMVTAKYGVTR